MTLYVIGEGTQSEYWIGTFSDMATHLGDGTIKDYSRWYTHAATTGFPAPDVTAVAANGRQAPHFDLQEVAVWRDSYTPWASKRSSVPCAHCGDTRFAHGRKGKTCNPESGATCEKNCRLYKKVEVGYASR